MHAYVDETGNTGARLLDDEQPLLVTAALMTRSDFDQRFAGDVKAIASSIGVDQLHASQLGLGRIEGIARDLLKVLRRAGPRFALARIEKRYVLATKVFDTIFDSYENKAVPWHVYNVRPLRIMMTFKIAYVLDEDLAAEFWSALLDVNNDRALAAMADFCRRLHGRVHLIPDDRSRKIAGDALEWAASNPKALEFIYSDKIGRKSHLPNMIGFGNLLSGIERQSHLWRRPVEVIRHDRQHEFAASMRFWHEMFSNAAADVIELPLGEKMVLRKVFGSRLEISSAEDSAGIQMVDLILWLFAKSLRSTDIPPNCQGLLNYVLGRAYQDDFSFDGVGASTEALISEIEAAPLPPGAMDRARELRDRLESNRLAAMQSYADEVASGS